MKYAMKQDSTANADIAGLSTEDKIQKAKEVTQNRILSQEDFRKLRLRQMAKTMDTDKKTGGQKKENAKDKKRKSTETLNVSLEEQEGNLG